MATTPLPFDTALAVTLYRDRDWTTAEIAAFMRVSTSTVRRRLRAEDAFHDHSKAAFKQQRRARRVKAGMDAALPADPLADTGLIILEDGGGQEPGMAGELARAMATGPHPDGPATPVMFVRSRFPGFTVYTLGAATERRLDFPHGKRAMAPVSVSVTEGATGKSRMVSVQITARERLDCGGLGDEVTISPGPAHDPWLRFLITDTRRHHLPQ